MEPSRLKGLEVIIHTNALYRAIILTDDQVRSIAKEIEEYPKFHKRKLSSDEAIDLIHKLVAKLGVKRQDAVENPFFRYSDIRAQIKDII